MREPWRDELDGHTQRCDWWSARQMLRQVLEADPRNLTAKQQLALCTYKDPEQLRQSALDEAEGLLLPNGPDDPAIDPETAGLVGAVHKRRWELDGREEHLRAALHWYDRGNQLSNDLRTFDGYQAVNAAFLRDLLAQLRSDESSEALREGARTLRQATLTFTGATPQPAAEWWLFATHLEALVGLGRRDEYLSLVRDAVTGREPGDSAFSPFKAWERQSTANQLARLATVLDPPLPDGDLREILRAVVPEAAADAFGAFGRRFGVAFSGGGFRASLFHLGVLAAFAERDLLRPLEVLSCVSGGSIVGAAYYSALAHELERTPDDALGPDELVQVVERCIGTFTSVVTGRNLRMESFFSPVAIVRGLRERRTSRTRRSGMLYVRHVYEELWERGRFGTLPQLRIRPAGDPVRDGFRPKVHNWRRATKVPTLILNATSLGTGRPWRFTASSMGEPVTADGVDPIDRLEPLWFDRPPDVTAVASVGDAVASSACVPGLFPPLVLRGLYPDRKVALVDGGVFDNQGVSGLLDHDCTDVFVSDASGLMGETAKPSSLVANVLLRTNAVALNAIRSTAFAETAATAAGGRLRTSWQIHLLSGIRPRLVHPSGAADAADAGQGDDAVTRRRNEVWRAISELRTDLDRFSPAEAWALMARAYQLTNDALDERPHPLARPRRPHSWGFLAIAPLVADHALEPRLLPELQRGCKLFFKGFPLGRRTLTAEEIRTAGRRAATPPPTGGA